MCCVALGEAGRGCTIAECEKKDEGAPLPRRSLDAAAFGLALAPALALAAAAALILCAA